MIEITIPSIGIAMTEALLVKWLKEPGDEIGAGDAVAEIETDKATMELESPADGRLGPHRFEPGAIVPVGAVIVEITDDGDTPRGAVAPTEEAEAPSPEPELPEAASPRPAAPQGTDRRRPHTMSPRARRLAREAGRDVPRRADRFRELVAAKVTEAWREIPHFAVTREVDAEAMLETLAALRASVTDPPATLTDLMLRGLALALQACGRGSGHVGLAVATPFGVLNPVVHDVPSLDPQSLARERAAAVDRAREGRLTPDDVETIPPSTLSNLGPFGVDHFTGLIPVGQATLLTVGRAVPRVVADADRRLSVRTTFHATLNSDHRTIDGAEAARLLAAFADTVEGMTAEFQEEHA